MNLGQIFELTGETLMVQAQVLLDSEKLWHRHPFTSPVVISGTVNNRAGLVTLNYSAEYDRKDQCDRCLKELCTHERREFSHVLSDKLQNDWSDILLVEGRELDIEELALTDFSVSEPTKILCSEQCAGLCSTCGKDLNLGSCNCPKTNIDPRMEALKKLLR